jgi:hypothetical protein
MKDVVAYIDEFGNSSLDFNETRNSTHFIVTAVIANKEKVKSLEEKLDRIRANNFQRGEIKSSKVAANDGRREKILKEICQLDFTIYAVVVNKKQLFSEGFRYKKSFYKFIHSLVDRELYKTFPNLEIVADEHGGNKFMEEFVAYIKKNHIPDLFHQSEFRFTNSKNLSLVQIADFVSGTLGRCYDETKISGIRKKFLALLNPKVIHIKQWPENYKSYTYEPKDFSEFNSIIADLGVNLAQQFIESNKQTNEPSVKDQVICLKYLLFYFKNINPSDYISTFELINRVTKVRLTERISIHYFRSKIIARLRDAGIIIASSSKGYKLPSNEHDLYDFLNHSSSIINPMIGRIKKVHESVLLATQKELDILDKEEYENLRKLIE